MKRLLYILPLLGLLLASCSDEEVAEQSTYGYVQFNVTAEGTRAAGTQLESLAAAAKVRVVLTHEGNAITQTLPLQRYNDETAEFGLQSDKLQLVAGQYTLTGFYLYDPMDREIYADAGGEDNTFEIVADGLHYQRLSVNAVPKGRVTFRLTKQFVTTRAEEEPAAYPFSSIRGASFTVKNLFTQETYNIDKVRVTIKSGHDTAADGTRIETTYGECDTLVWLPAGNYRVTSYTTYSDRKCKYPLEVATVQNAPSFVVAMHETTEQAAVPIRMSVSSERLKDYIALKAIWEALDGPHWKYFGEAATPGTNWNFDKDMDLWGEQPGVSLDNDGRVSTLSLIGFGPRGVVPDEIGQFTQMRTLYLSAHDETLGNMTGNDLSSYITPAAIEARRTSYEEMYLHSDPRAHLSEPMREFINKDPQQRPVRQARIALKDVQMGYYTNHITGISRALQRCTGLQQLYIANSPITTDGFFRDIQPDSPFADEDLSWANLTNLTDVEIYNCPKLTGLPMEMLTGVPELQVLNAASNPNIPAAQLKADWEALIDGKCGDKVQVIYFGFNSLEETPSYDQLKRMKSLAALDLSSNKLHTVHPFGKEINLVKLYLNNNRLTKITPAPDGYFSDFQDVEIMNFSFNQLTEVPDIFNAKSVYTIDNVDCSHNNITQLEHGAAFKGINATTVDISYNPLKEFPKELFSTGSPIAYLILAGCGIEEIPEGAMTGPKSSYMRSIDFSLNKLKELPDDFYATNMPYVYGIDLSGNQFESIPGKPFDNYTLTVFILRNQRDEQGNRTLKGWLTGLYQHPSLRALYLGGNDLRKINDTISPNIYVFEIKDNPNISIDLSGVCAHIQSGYYQLFYDKTQDIRGCAALDIEN